MNAGAFCRTVSAALLLFTSPLFAEPTVRGIVLDAKKMASPGARAELLRLDGRPVAVVATDASGRYVLSADRPGLFNVRIVSTGMEPLVFGPVPLLEDTELPPSAAKRADGWRLAPAATPAAAKSPAVAAPEDLVVTGRVVTESGSRALAGALVWSGADPGAAVLTDSEGRYRLRVPAEGSFWIQAQAPGRLPQRITPTAAQLLSRRVPSLALPPGEGLAGRVVDSSGVPLEGVWVTAMPATRNETAARPRRPPVRGAMSAAGGLFRLTLLKPGELYRLEADRPGFLRASLQASTPASGRRAAGPVTLVLAPARSGFGVVHDVQHRPVQGAAVRIAPAGSVEGLEMIADPQGRFVVPEVPAPAVDLVVSKPGFASAIVRNFKIQPGAGPIDFGSLPLRAGAAVRGIVSDPRNRPIAGAKIFRVEELDPAFEMVERLRGEEPSALSAPDGSFTLADLPRGLPVHLLVSAPGYLPSTVRGLRPPMPPAKAPLRVRLEAGAAVSGRVVDAKGAPVRGAQVGLIWRATAAGRPDLFTGPPLARSTKAGADGRFQLKDLPAGAAFLSASAPGFVEAEEIRIALPQAPGSTATIVLERGAVLAGRVTTTAGEPVSQARILAGTAAGLSDSEGIFSLDGVPAGSLGVEARHPHYETFRKTVRIENGTNQLEVVFEAGREVRGRVVDPAGAPVAGASVVLAGVARQSARSLDARTDPEGAFVLAPVAAGRYRLRASAQGFADAELSQAVIVGRQEVQGLEVVLAPGGEIAGRVLGLESEELPRLAVRARHESGEETNAEVDAAGRYRLRSLRAGDWLLRAVVGDGQRQVQARVPLAAGEEKTRDLRFEGDLKLSGVVIYRDEPLAEASVSIRGEHLAVERSLVTDYEGRFRFEDLEADSYLLSLTHVRELLTHNQTVELAADREVTVRLERGTVSGIVLDAESSEPLTEARIDLRHIAGADGPEFLLGGGSDANGAFRLERVPPGSYRLIVSREGYSPAERPVEMPAGDDLSDLEVPLQPAPGAELSVRLASGKVPAFLHLRLQAPDGSPVLVESRPIAADGTLRITTAPPGSWELLAAGPEAALTSLPLAVPGKREALVLANAAPLSIRVPPLADSDAIATLSIAMAGGQPLKILGPGGNFTHQWPLVAGRATVEGVPAGNWMISAAAPDGRTWTASIATNGRSAAQVSLE